MRIACLLLALAASAASAQDAAAQRPGAAASAALLTQSVTAELKILCRVGGLDEATSERLQKELVPVTREFANTLSAKGGKFERYSPLPSALRKRVADAVCGATSDAKAVAAVRDDVAARNAFQVRIPLDGFVALVDHAAWLSSKQVAETRKLGQQLQKQGKLPNCLQLLRSGLAADSAQTELKKILTAEQFANWVGVRKGLGQEASIVGDSNMSRDERRKQLRDGYAKRGEEYIRWYTTELTLEPKQVKRLQLSLKGLISRAVPAELERHDKQDKEQPNPAAMGFESVLSRPFASDQWLKFLKATLTEEQIQKLDHLMTQRGNRLSQLMSGYIITALSSGHKSGGEKEMWLDAKQQLATHKLMLRQFATLRTLDGALPGQFVRLAVVPDAEYEQAMGPENWKQFEPMVQQLREMAKAMGQ